MILEAFSLISLFISMVGWGTWINFFFSIKNRSLALTTITGLSVVSVLSCFFSFFFPLDSRTELFLLLLSILPFFSKKQRTFSVKLPKEVFKSVWFWLFFCIISLAGSYYCFRPDHFSYYIPSLNWLNNYGLIKGVANIDWALGQMSLFHFTQAGLDNTLDFFQRINIFVSIIFLIYIFEKKSFLLLLFIPFYFLFIQSSSPDVPIVFFSLIVVNELCFNSEKTNFLLLFSMSFFLFAIKPIVFWLPIWVFAIGVYQYKKEVLSIKSYYMPTLFVIAFLLKNYIASSTLFFPITFTQINSYWITDPRILNISDKLAAFYTFNYYFSLQEIESFSFFQKIYYWLTIPILQTAINLFMVITVICFGIFSFFIKKKFIYKSLWVIVLLKLVITFVFSGQYRFMLDSIYPLLFILLYYTKLNQSKIVIPILFYYILLLGLISYPQLIQRIFPSFNLTSMIKGGTKMALLKPNNYTLDKYKQEKIGNLNFNLSAYYPYNFDTPPPAFEMQMIKLYREMNIFPQMKDSTNIHKGFYMKKISEKEKMQLDNLILNFTTIP